MIMASYSVAPEEDSFVKEVQNRFKENAGGKYPWTIYFLVDLKVVYIMTYAFITIVNLISSTANSEALSDRNSMMLLNVSSKYMNVNVTSINDAILWNCRKFSETKSYYQFLYWMLLLALIVALTGFFAIKFIILITVSNGFGYKCCSCRYSTFKHGLTKLWHIAICQHLINPVSNNCVKGPDNQGTSTREDQTSASKFANVEFYNNLFKKDIPDSIIDDIEEFGGCKNCCRSTIPYILLTLLVIILFLAYLSFDLHPLACITKSEEHITYDHDKNAVELEFSDELSTYQTIAGYLCLGLGLIFLICVKIFFLCTKLVVNDMQQHFAKNIQRYA